MNKKMLIVGLTCVFASSGNLFAIIKKAGKVARNTASTTGEVLGSEKAQQMYLSTGTLGMANGVMALGIKSLLKGASKALKEGNYSEAIQRYIEAIGLMKQNGGSPVGQPSERWVWNRVHECVSSHEEVLDTFKEDIHKGYEAIAMVFVRKYIDNKASEMCHKLGVENQETNPTLAEKYFTVAKSLGYSKNSQS